MVALRESRGGAGLGGLGLLPRCGLGLGWVLTEWDGMGKLSVTPDNFGMRTR
jgi:hypothetical protein